MAPTLRPKPNTHARMKRTSTQFSELEVTPNRPGEKSHHPGGQDAGALILDENEEPIKPFSWSDAGSTTNNTRRSSPADLGEISSDDVWDFDESIAPFSSPNSEKNKLPDTVPLTCEGKKDQSPVPVDGIDFSETASTIRRSSPFGASHRSKDIWNFDDSPPDSSPPTATSKNAQIISSDHLPDDELYDSTPKKVAVPEQALSELIGDQSVPSSDIKGGSTKPSLQSKGKRQRPKAKKPICFDPLTQEMVDRPSSKKKKKPATTRLPIVSALQEAAKASSSPLAAPEKQKKPKRARPQKKAKPETRSAPENPPPSRSMNDVAFIDKPAQPIIEPIVESPSECVQDLPNLGKRDDMKGDQSVAGGDVFHRIQVPQRQNYPPPPTIQDFDNSPDYRTATLPAERGRSKKRRLSRQFSVSEKGSPVVVMNAAPSMTIDQLSPEPDPVQACNLEELLVAKSSSFLRSASNDKHLEQQRADAFDDIGGRSSSQWLRRLSDREPARKRKSSMGKKLRDEIMKSFLGHAEVAQEPNVNNVSCATIPNHAEKQMHRTIDQLVARLDDRKTAAFKVAGEYRKSGASTVAHLKQQCLQDSNSLIDTFRKDSGLFGKRLRAATISIEGRGSGRAETAVALDTVMESRRQGYARARLSLRAMRDELTRDKAITTL
ncbi:hypothetical protein V8C35DRAFT_279158 [Trichoderma chlorosporum]